MGLVNRFAGLLVLFAGVSLAVFFLKDQLGVWKIDYRVVLAANVLLFILGVVSLSLHIRALTKPNPNVFVRSVMLANIIKLFTLASVALVYIKSAGKASANAVFVSLFLYIVYTWVEKRATVQLSKSKKS
ncbi:MAG TPA: hypothetical protein VF145_13475 [Chitinophagaceae bacterium]